MYYDYPGPGQANPDKLINTDTVSEFPISDSAWTWTPVDTINSEEYWVGSDKFMRVYEERNNKTRWEMRWLCLLKYT